MPYQPHTYVTCGGSNLEVASNDEIWQVGIRGFSGGNVPVPQGDLAELVAKIAVGADTTSGLARWFAVATYYHCNDSFLKWVKVANINASGDYSGEPAIYEFGTPIAGGAGKAVPSFLSASLGFTTGKSFGRARSGRIYPPNYGAPSTFGAAISAAAQTNLVASALEFLSAVSQPLGDGGAFVPHVVSKSGVSNAITGVRVGNIWDVQRRRKNAVAETYATSPV